jgi:hypothetical protein
MTMRKALLTLALVAMAAIWTTSVAAKDKPDLVIASQDLIFTPALPAASVPLACALTIHNAGAIDSKACTVLAKVTHKPKKAFKVTVAVPAIPAGGSVQVQIHLETYLAGNYAVLVKVDPANKVKESAEGNNRILAPFTVIDPNPFLGQGAAAAFGALSQLTASVLDAVATGIGGIGTAESAAVARRAAQLAALTGGRPEATRDCTKAGAFEYLIAMDSTRIRPGTLTATSPAPGGLPCEEWLNHTGTEPDLGAYSRYTGRLSLDIAYQSNSPFDPGFIKPSTIVMKTGDGVPGTMNPLPDFVTEYRALVPDGQSAPKDLLLLTQDADYTATATVLGLGTDGMPNHMRFALSGALTSTGGAAAESLTGTYSGYEVEVTYAEEAGARLVTMVTRGSVALSNTANPGWDFSLDYHDFTRIHRIAVTQTEVAVNGSVDVASSCLTGAIAFATSETIVIPQGSVCPNAGKVAVTSPMGSATLLFFSDGSMGVDDNSDGTVDHTYTPCTEADQLRCP